MRVDAGARRGPWQRFLERRAARVGLWMLAILATSAAWAPFLANDRPYVLVASDHGALERARREVVPLAASLADLVRGEKDADARGGVEAQRAIREEARALEHRLDTLEVATGWAVLQHLRDVIDALRSTPDAVQADALLAAARDVRTALDGRELVAPRTRTYPLFASLDAIDVFVASLPLALAGAWWFRRARRTSGGRAIGVATAVALVLALGAHLFAADRAYTAQGSLKAAVASGSIAVDEAVFPPIPFGFAETNLQESWRPPSWFRPAPAAASRPAVGFGEPEFDARHRHVLGTDGLGRDVAARVLWGGRISLAIGVAAAALLSLIGILLGAAAGALGGRVDAVISRAIEVVLCFPAFFLVLCAIAWTDPDIVPVPLAIVLVIAAVGWTSTARLVRAEALRVVASDYVLAARALGLHPVRVLVRHVLPNSIGPAWIAFGFAAGGAIGVESSLAFLGLGAQVPVPSWGGLVGEARGADQAWAWIAPGFLVFLAVLAWVLVAEAAREALDPRATTSVVGAPSRRDPIGHGTDADVLARRRAGDFTT